MRTLSPEGSAAASCGRSAGEHLRVEHLTAGYGRVAIVNDVSIEALPRQIASLIGPNGAGKSTLLKAVVGAIPAMSGSISLRGHELTRLRIDERVRRGVAYVPQIRDVFAPLSVQENLEMGGYLVPAQERSRRIQEVFEMFPLLAARRDQRADTLSGGERKMLAIGRVSMTRPAVLLLDEPTANLSPRAAHELLTTHVRNIVSSGVAVLLVEQRAMEALAVSDNVYVIVAGGIAASGPPEQLGDKDKIAQLFLGATAAQASPRARNDTSVSAR
jgi:branched-chain amino acid transport system ATP-binding protein